MAEKRRELLAPGLQKHQYTRQLVSTQAPCLVRAELRGGREFTKLSLLLVSRQMSWNHPEVDSRCLLLLTRGYL
jgi:hypothetical protein